MLAPDIILVKEGQVWLVAVSHPELHSKFPYNLGYRVTSCLKKTNTPNKQNQSGMFRAVHNFIEQFSTAEFIIIIIWAYTNSELNGWRDGSPVKSTCCCARELGLRLTWQSIVICNSSSRSSDAFIWPLQAPVMHVLHIHTQSHVCMYLNPVPHTHK